MKTAALDLSYTSHLHIGKFSRYKICHLHSRYHFLFPDERNTKNKKKRPKTKTRNKNPQPNQNKQTKQKTNQTKPPQQKKQQGNTALTQQNFSLLK